MKINELKGWAVEPSIGFSATINMTAESISVAVATNAASSPAVELPRVDSLENQLIAGQGKQIYDAVRAIDIKAVTDILSSHSLEDCTAILSTHHGDFLYTPLMLAIRVGYEDMVHLLLQHNAALEDRDKVRQ